MPRRHVAFSASSPSVIVPLTGRDDAALAEQVRLLPDRGVDVVEWRLDLHSGVLADLPGTTTALAALESLRRELDEALPEVPLLATLRTSAEGGSADCSGPEYSRLVGVLADSGHADLVDVEYRHAGAAEAIRLAKAAGVQVVASNHDFEATPCADEIVERLTAMEATGADVAKIAVMPGAPEDVAVLLQATARRSVDATRPIVTVSMGALGLPSRLVGGRFGSAATFATVGSSSAPGQVPLDDVRTVLDLLRTR